MKKLIQEGVNIEEPDRDGYTPLLAVDREKLDIVITLVEAGANLRTFCSSGKELSALEVAILGSKLSNTDHAEIAKVLIEAGASSGNVVDNDAHTLTHYDVAEELVQAGADATLLE